MRCSDGIIRVHRYVRVLVYEKAMKNVKNTPQMATSFYAKVSHVVRELWWKSRPIFRENGTIYRATVTSILGIFSYMNVCLGPFR